MNHKQILRIFLACLLFSLPLLLTQCRLQPRGIPEKEQMKAVMRELILLQASSGSQSLKSTDSLTHLRYLSILDKYGYEVEEYDSALVWYSKNAHLLNQIYDELNDEFSKAQTLLDSAILDSTELYALKYTPAQSLWTRNSRIAINKNRSVYYLYQSLYGVFLGDTVDFSINITPPLSGQQMIDTEILALDSSDMPLFRQRRIIEHDALSTKVFFVLPDSLPGKNSIVRWDFIFRYSNSLPKLSPFPAFITFDSIALYKRISPSGVRVILPDSITQPHSV